MPPKHKRHMSLRTVNNALLICIIAVNLYTMIAPLVPVGIFWWQKHHTPHSQQLSQLLNRPNDTNNNAGTTTPSQNSLIIPAMMLNAPIYDGPVSSMYKTLDKGVWRWPSSSTPDKGGNTVLIGHRFTYTNPNGIFYHLDQVKVGDQIGAFWAGTRYVYTVASVSVVPPTQVSILAPTTDAQLTLYTCTPTWNPKNRLVVVAKLVSVRSFKAS